MSCIFNINVFYIYIYNVKKKIVFDIYVVCKQYFEWFDNENIQ